MSPYKPILDYFSVTKRNEIKKMSLFEAGFGDFGFVLDLYYFMPFSYYHGIEKFPESELTIMYDNGEGYRNSGVYSPKDSIYTKYLIYCEETNKPKAHTETEFNSIFKLEFDNSIETFISNSRYITKEYDLGVFSKLFHKFPEKQTPQKIVEWFYSNSASDSFLLFTVMTSDKYAVKGVDFVYNLEDIYKILDNFPGRVIEHLKLDSFDTYLIQKNGT